MSSSLLVTQRNVDGVVVLSLKGRLIFDEDGEDLLRDSILTLVEGGHRAILVDLRGVSYIDSRGVGTLVSMYLRTHKRGGQLKLLSPSDRVMRVLQVTRLDTVFEIFTDERKAVASFEHALSV